MWDEEGRYVQITLTRRHSERSCVLPDALDFVDVELNTSYGTFCYRTEGRDLCYAVARAVTETLKKYGFMGYCLSSDPDCRSEETFDINKLLFLKAYALDVPEARQIVRLWEDPNGWMSADASCFQKEMELLLFDM